MSRPDPLAANVHGSPPSRPVEGRGVTERHRSVARALLWLKLWRREVRMRMVDVEPVPGWRRWLTRRIHDRMLRHQVLDDLHHAPACPANHYHRRRLVLLGCTCGAQREADAKLAEVEAAAEQALALSRAMSGRRFRFTTAAGVAVEVQGDLEPEVVEGVEAMVEAATAERADECPPRHGPGSYWQADRGCRCRWCSPTP